jgi:hypothetical protein
LHIYKSGHSRVSGLPFDALGTGANSSREFPESTMLPPPNYDFHFGKDRYLRGSGWLGILALISLLIAAVTLSHVAEPATVALGDIIQRLVSGLGKLL